MIAQAFGTLLHVVILVALMERFEDHAIYAIGVATSISSFTKLIFVLGLGFCQSDIRKAYISPCHSFSESPTQCVPSSFMSIGLPSMIMYCSEGWANQLLTLIAGFFSVEDQAV